MDVAHSRRHLVRMDGGQHEDEHGGIHAPLRNVVPQVIAGEVALEDAAALGMAQGILLSAKSNKLTSYRLCF